MEQQSDDIEGYVRIPRRLPIATLVAIVVLVFGFGGWATAHQISDTDHEERLELVEQRWERIEKFMCVVCVEKGAYECSDICGIGRFRRGK